MKFITALTFVLLLSASVFAKEALFTACTADNKVVALQADISEELQAKHDVVAHVAKAFEDTAPKFTYEQLLSETGFKAFMDALDHIDTAALSFDEGPRVVEGVRCRS